MGTHRKNILLMNLSLFTAFLFFPLGISVHICGNTMSWHPCCEQILHTSFTFSNTYMMDA